MPPIGGAKGCSALELTWVDPLPAVLLRCCTDAASPNSPTLYPSYRVKTCNVAIITDCFLIQSYQANQKKMKLCKYCN